MKLSPDSLARPAEHPPRLLAALLTIVGLPDDADTRFVDLIFQAQTYEPQIYLPHADGCVLSPDDVEATWRLRDLVQLIRKTRVA